MYSSRKEKDSRDIFYMVNGTITELGFYQDGNATILLIIDNIGC